ncbi:unnamed protein product [Periconia digitata]|uniref:Uncharacterized protein n=1 Tax=Periconia digitata TaxID=1303443 RepID=A0A9W4UMH7_9PLEO|nr:unnamed protein product [Periconia digitata]
MPPPSSTRIPPLLQPCVQLPTHDSILLVTSTLGASVNWLLVRFLCNALNNPHQPSSFTSSSSNNNAENTDDDEEFNVVLVSWMRDYEFWKSEARKSGGVDLDRLRRDGRVAVVDGLSGVFLGSGAEKEDDDVARRSSSSFASARGGVPSSPISSAPAPAPAPARAGIAMAPGRGPMTTMRTMAGGGGGTMMAAKRDTAVSSSTPSTSTSTPTPAPQTQTQKQGLFILSSPDLAHVQSIISAAVTSLSTATSGGPTRKTLVILDNPDLLLATSSTTTTTKNTAITTPASLTSLFLTLHALPTVAHVAVHLQADTPLLHTPASLTGLHQQQQPPPLEIAQRNLLVKTAFMSSRVLGVRVLDTGVARDVSGVLRVTEEGGGGIKREVLYRVGGDGGVRVFERGGGG